jgi:hypothetical protein
VHDLPGAVAELVQTVVEAMYKARFPLWSALKRIFLDAFQRASSDTPEATTTDMHSGDVVVSLLGDYLTLTPSVCGGTFPNV